MTDAERRRAMDAAARAVHREQVALQADTYNEIVRLLNDALSKIKAALADEPSDFQRWQLPQLQREIERVLNQMSTQAGQAAGEAMGRSWEQGQAVVDKPLSAAGVRVAAVAPVLDVQRLFAMRAFATDRIKDIGVQAANRINTQLGLVVIGAQTPAEATTEVTRILGEPSRERAMRIVKTELGRAYSAATQLRMEQVIAIAPGMKKRWRRSNKKHPRLHHHDAHGQVRAVKEPFDILAPRLGVVKMLFPRDPAAPVGEVINCGCVAEPYMVNFQDIMDRKAA